jgi:membrane-bound ClpP family serine protease
LWNARAQKSIDENTKVRVIKVINLLLEVEPVEETASV